MRYMSGCEPVKGKTASRVLISDGLSGPTRSEWLSLGFGANRSRVVGGRGRRKRGRRGGRASGPGSKRRASPPSDSARRTALLERVADHLLDYGISSFSLRSAADLVGASARMLVHHFGSKERLLSEALALVRTRRVAHFAEAMASPVETFDQVFRQSWKILASAEFRRYFLLNHETLGLALREPDRYREVLHTTTEEWRGGLAGALLAQGFAPDDATAVSTLYLASLRGLLLDLVVTGDEDRVADAVALLAEKLKADLERNAAAVSAASTAERAAAVGPPTADRRRRRRKT
jgi:AcrR family transcriptional regulator